MGWLSRLGRAFGFGAKQNQPSQPPSFAEQARLAAKRIAEETAEEVAFRILKNEPTSEFEKFISFGEWISVQSSNVRAISYVKLTAELHIEYHDGSFYGYGPVNDEMAADLYRASSKGKWVWDHLRRRGTVFGYQVEYWFLSGPSKTRTGNINDYGGLNSVRNWMGTAASRKAHGSIGPSGKLSS
jgi:hypothetical protein